MLDQRDFSDRENTTDKARDERRLIGEAVICDGLNALDFDNERVNNFSGSEALSETQLYAGKLKLGTSDNLIGMMISAVISPAALKSGIENGTILAQVNKYMTYDGLDVQR